MEVREPLAIFFLFYIPNLFLSWRARWSGDIVLAVMPADFCIFRMLF